MKVSDITQIEGFTTVSLNDETQEVNSAYTGDLLSDVIANVGDDAVLITVQAHKNTIAVCSLSNMPAIVICNGRSCPPDMVSAAEDNDISIFTTDDTQFLASVKIAKALNL